MVMMGAALSKAFNASVATFSGVGAGVVDGQSSSSVASSSSFSFSWSSSSLLGDSS
jgi:hypothetical protein